MSFTEVQLLSFVCSTGGKGRKSSLWNLQNLGSAPPGEGDPWLFGEAGEIGFFVWDVPGAIYR